MITNKILALGFGVKLSHPQRQSFSMKNLPDDLRAEILGRLPVKSLLRFRCVSNSWLSTITDPDFIRSHLALFKNNRQESHLLVVEANQGPLQCYLRCTKTLAITAGLINLYTDIVSGASLTHETSRYDRVQWCQGARVWHLVCSADGLFMLASPDPPDPPSLMLWNPSIRKMRALPPSPEIPQGTRNVDFGFGFDPSSKDYKHVRVVLSNSTGFAAVYTLGTNSWREIEFRGEGCSMWRGNFCLLQSALCLKGVLYVILRRSRRRSSGSSRLRLVSFDLSSEVFASTELPRSNDAPQPHLYCQALMMADGKESLALFSFSQPNTSVWVLERIGDDIKSSSWNQVYTFPTRIPKDELWAFGSVLLYIKKNGEILLNKQESVTSYNIETREETVSRKKRIYVHKAWPYMENLYWFSQVEQ